MYHRIGLSRWIVKKAELRWRCANLMRFITLQVALFSSNGILYRRAPVCIVFVYRYTSILAVSVTKCYEVSVTVPLSMLNHNININKYLAASPI